ncbi:MAG: microcin C ABC transporter permease YejB, partial [Pseudomonadales bacterium]|nr:microcin C ABC transporter permease YejB [Pseudomonadales bacterium]
MGVYIVKRILLLIPTLLGIITINFVVVQFAPGGPVEQIIAQVTTGTTSTTSSISGGGDSGVQADAATSGAQELGSYGLDPDLIADLERQFGFDKPAHERFFDMVVNYMQLDFGTSFFQDRPVLELILERMPVSISLGLWSLLLIYGISIPLGVAKAVRDGTRFDIWTSTVIFVGYAIPGFLFAVLLIVLFAGGNYLDIFPLRGLVSQNWDSLSWPDRILDYFWHLALPITALSIGGFATLTMLTKNSFREEINKQFVITAYAKGLQQKRVLYGHVFRNAMLIVIAGFPAAFVGLFFTGSLLIEVIFSLDGMGLL